MSGGSSASKAVLSKDAVPFIPSFMRTPAASAQADTTSGQPLATSEAERLNGDCASVPPEDAGRDESPVASWNQYISAMEEVEIEMLIDMMPAEVQMVYNESLHRANKAAAATARRDAKTLPECEGGADAEKHEYQEAPSAEERRRRAVEAATSTFGELTTDQLFFLEEFLHEEGGDVSGGVAPSTQMHALEEALEGAVGGNMFGNGGDEMNSEEEEWLLEQMMGPLPTVAATATKARKPAKRVKKSRQ